MTHQKARILIVDDEEDICDILFRLLQAEGFMPLVAHDGETALEMIRLGMPDAVLSDVRMPGINGMELLRRAKKLDAHLPILLITAWGGIDAAVQAVKEGASDYLTKPFNKQDLLCKIKLALEERRPSVAKRIVCDTAQNAAIMQLQEMMGPSESVQRIISDAALVAPSNFSVVIQGETGTGKEVVAKALHEASQRSKAPLIPVDCGAIPETLFESELFGHEKGAFTGAIHAKPGKFELAQRGTLFLDEISNMPLSSQIKILRAIQERSFFRVGGSKAVTVDVRLIVATNEDLDAAVSAGSFSRDLFYRLSEFTIRIPPLRERKEDIIHIADQILRDTNIELGKTIRGFSKSAVRTLVAHDWPGNVRQLRSAVRRAVLQAEEQIEPAHLAVENLEPAELETMTPAPEGDWSGLSLKEIVRRSTADLERKVLIQSLRKTGGNKAKAARLLKIDYTTLHAKIKLYGITVDPEEEAE